MRNIVLFLALTCLASSCVGQQNPAHTGQVVSANDGVLAAFGRAPLVGLADDHALAQEEDYYVSLISDPRFAKEVGNVVVEFGNASQQQTIDRYVNGDDMPYAELRKVWGDTSYVGWFPTVTALGYLNFYAAVRAANAKLPIDEHIHVWLGGRPVDWAKIKTREDLSKYVGGQADRFTVDLIDQQIFSQNKKALLIYGTFHFYDKGTLADLIRQRHPGTLYVVTPYTGFADRSCSEQFESNTTGWPSPAIVDAIGLPKYPRAPNCILLTRQGLLRRQEYREQRFAPTWKASQPCLLGTLCCTLLLPVP